MAVKAFRIENFMAFGEAASPDDGWIELQPICLLFGRNSSGKSAIIRALRLLKQSLVDAPAGSPFAYSVEDGVDVGSFLEMAHRPYPSEDPPIVRFGFRCDVSPVTLGRLVSGFSPVSAEEAQVDLTLGFGWLPLRKQAGLVELLVETRVNIEAQDSRRRTIFRAEMIEPTREPGKEDQWWYQSDILTGEEPYEIWELVTPQLRRGFLAQLVAPQGMYDEMRAQEDWDFGQDLELLRALLRELQETIAEFFEKIEHARPLRPEPRRLFVMDDSQQRRWREMGLHGFLRLLRGEEDISRARLEELNTWLRRLKLGDSIWAETHTDSPDRAIVTSLFLDEGEDGVRKVNLADMGYGVSQVLPVLVQAILAQPGELVIVEQPELHLHPAAQAEMGDVFIAMAKRGVRFLIETHSEHLLLRLRRKIAESSAGKIAEENQQYLVADSLRAYFVDRGESTSHVETIGIDSSGRMSSPPGFRGFFADDLRELALLNQAILDAQTEG